MSPDQLRPGEELPVTHLCLGPVSVWAPPRRAAALSGFGGGRGEEALTPGEPQPRLRNTLAQDSPVVCVSSYL